MPALTEKVLIGWPPRWLDASFVASSEEAGGPAGDLALPGADSGWLVDMSAGTEVSVVIDAGVPVDLNGIFLDNALCTGFGAEDLRVKVETASDVGITTDVTEWTSGGGSLVPYRMASAGPAAARLDMTQPGIGPTDAELNELMADGRFRHLSQLETKVSRRFARLTFDHTATPAAGQFLELAHAWGGLAVNLDFNPQHGKISPRRVAEPNNRFLYALKLTTQIIREDELWTRIQGEFFERHGVQNRAWIWYQPDFLERFYKQAFMAQVFQEPIEITAEFDETAYKTDWALDFVERFSVETDR